MEEIAALSLSCGFSAASVVVRTLSLASSACCQRDSALGSAKNGSGCERLSQNEKRLWLMLKAGGDGGWGEHVGVQLRSRMGAA